MRPHLSFDTDTCWLCRRTKVELTDLGIKLYKREVDYEERKDPKSGRTAIAVCLICDYLLRNNGAV